MPKIIENLPQRLMAEARRQIEESGFAAMTIRSVAKACGVGVGTVYNYFSSKDDLLASSMQDDWMVCVAAMGEVAGSETTPEAVARAVYDELSDFVHRHNHIFRDEAAAKSFANSFRVYHGLLRSQLAAPMRRFFSDDFGAEFAAESLLTWAMAHKDFDTIWSQLKKLF